MQLFAKRIVFLIADGVQYEDMAYLKRGLEMESAEVFITTAEPQLMVMAHCADDTSKEVYIDFPVECADANLFDGLVIPDGARSVEAICADQLAVSTVKKFYQAQKPIIASGAAVRILEEQSLYPGQLVVREGKARSYFLEEAIESIAGYTSTGMKEEVFSE